MTSTLDSKQNLAAVPIVPVGELPPFPDLVLYQIKALELDFGIGLQLYDKQRRLRFRVFAAKSVYLTQEFDPESGAAFRWRTANLQNLIGGWSHRCFAPVDTQTEEILRRFVGEEKALGKTAINAFMSYQEELMKDMLHKKHQKIIDKVEKKMKQVPSIPKDFADWVDEKPLHSSRYLYYDYNGKKTTTAFCSHCQKEGTVENPRNNQPGICPFCGTKATLKAAKKTGSIRDTATAILVQVLETGRLFRYFEVGKVHRKDHRKEPSTWIHESIRVFKEIGGNRAYYYGNFKQTGVARWHENPGFAPNNYSACGVLYDRNLEEIAQRYPEYRYAALRELTGSSPGYSFDVSEYLRIYPEFPEVEYLAKMGLTALVTQVSMSGYRNYQQLIKAMFNLPAKNPKKLLGITTENIKLLQAINGDARDLELIRKAERRGVRLQAEQVIYLNRTLSYASYLVKILERTTFHKAKRYIEEQTKRYQKDPEVIRNFYYKPKVQDFRNRAAQDWRDYVENCLELKKDLQSEFILFPKNLKDAHDRSNEEIQVIRDEEKRKEKEKQYKILRKMTKKLDAIYAMESEQFLIRAPKSATEIIDEGKALHHCVERYIPDMAKESTLILILRKKSNPNKPYCTVEVRNGEVAQYQCYDNKKPAEETEAKELHDFIQRFIKMKLMPAQSRAS